MTFPRRKFLHLAAGAAALPAVLSPARAQVARSLAERLADCADRLRYDDLDAATIEQVKSLVIDTLGCGVAALDEAPVRICRDVALAFASTGGVSTVIGTDRRAAPDLAAFANGAA